MQELNLHLLHWQLAALLLSYQGSPCVCVCVCVCIHTQIPIYRYLPIYTYNVIGICNIHMNTLNLYLYSVIYMTLYKYI